MQNPSIGREAIEIDTLLCVHLTGCWVRRAYHSFWKNQLLRKDAKVCGVYWIKGTYEVLQLEGCKSYGCRQCPCHVFILQHHQPQPNIEHHKSNNGRKEQPLEVERQTELSQQEDELPISVPIYNTGSNFATRASGAILGVSVGTLTLGARTLR